MPKVVFTIHEYLPLQSWLWGSRIHFFDLQAPDDPGRRLRKRKRVDRRDELGKIQLGQLVMTWIFLFISFVGCKVLFTIADRVTT